jgi:CheY-like chemotaxis protein
MRKFNLVEPSPGLAWVAPEPQPATQQGPSAQTGSLQGKLALVVEDSWHIAFAMKCLLENAGLVVIGPAADTDAAEALLSDRRPDVALIDINLRGETALDLVETLKARSIPVIVVSGSEMPDGLAGKVEAFLTKPVRSRALMAMLRSVLDPGAGTS